jgi:hypothetical protein
MFLKNIFKKRNMFYGINLNFWNYLGFSTIYFTYSNNSRNISDQADILFFSKRENEREKIWIFKNKKAISTFKQHNFVRTCEEWRINEIYGNPIRYPSNTFKEIMLKKGYIWNQDDFTWYHQNKFNASGENILHFPRKY